MSQTLPPALLNRLRRDEVNSNQLLERGELDDAVKAVRNTAERKLLSITPKAVDTIEEVMDMGGTKERLAAAVAVIEHSPATKQQVMGSSQEAAIPVEALKGVLEGIGKMFALGMDHKHSQMRSVAPEPLPEPVIAPKKRGRPRAKP